MLPGIRVGPLYPLDLDRTEIHMRDLDCGFLDIVYRHDMDNQAFGNDRQEADQYAQQEERDDGYQ